MPLLLASPHLPFRFHVLSTNVHLSGYQMYAVQKWLVERRPVTVLLVYTGDPSHSVTLSALAPLPSLSPPDAQLEWDNALQLLRRDGARPKQTPHGVLMATSLAHFRSDYTIVLIPDGNLAAVRDQLYTNINLLRMGCSGRSALTLEDPSDVTKSRFISTFHFPDSIAHSAAVTSIENLALTKTRSHSHSRSNSVLNFTKYSDIPTAPPSTLSKAKAVIGLGLPSTLDPKPSPSKEKPKPDNSLFNATVLELVKLIQAGLFFFGMFGKQSLCLDGLLCDETVEGIRRWIVEIGAPNIGLEPMERIADPMFVSALISLILCVRNKLAVLAPSLLFPKDPFLQPQPFASALTAYVQSTHPTTASAGPSPSSSPSHRDLVPQAHHFGHVSGGSYIFPPHVPHLLVPNLPHTHAHAHAHQLTPTHSGASASGSGSSTTPTPAPAPPQPPAVLTRELVDTIWTAYDLKMGSADGRAGGRRVRRALREKLRAGVESDLDGSGTPDPGRDRDRDRDRDRGALSGGEGDAGVGLGGAGGGAGAGASSGIGIVGGERSDRERAREREPTLGGVGTGVSSSGGQILSGIGSFASGLGLGVGPGAWTTGAGALTEATCDMTVFVRSIYSKDGKKSRKGRSRNEEAELLGVGYGYGYGSGYGKDAGVGLSVRALWSGQVNSVIKLREWEMEKGRMSGSVAERKGRGGERDRGAMSDGDVDDTVGALAKSETEEESDGAIQPGSFRWGERVQRKLGSWAGLSKRRGNASLDLTSSASRGDNNLIDPLATARPDMARGRSSPLLPPIVFSGGDNEPDAYDDDLLSSGQVSPVDNLRPHPFTLLPGAQSLESTSVNTSEYERKVTEFNRKRPGNRVSQSRITSWADPMSAREFLDDEGGEDVEGRSSRSKKRRKRGNTMGTLPSVLSETASENWEELAEVESAQEGLPVTKRRMTFGQDRRRSFHDLTSLRGMRVIPLEHMRVDVELSGQLLILSRRSQHLENVIACLRVLTSSLSTNNTLLREDYTAHAPFVSQLDMHAQVISTIDAENAKADKTSQTTNTLRYEAEQFRVPDVWHSAVPSRQAVLTLREKVFGTGSRRLPAGVHGAHGRFNRLQWTLDGRERLVDHLGRTESEVEEEEPGAEYLGSEDEEEEEDVVQHSGIKPMWLLRFFTSWGARWGASAAAATAAPTSQPLDASNKTTPPSTPMPDGKGKPNGNDKPMREGSKRRLVSGTIEDE